MTLILSPKMLSSSGCHILNSLFVLFMVFAICFSKHNNVGRFAWHSLHWWSLCFVTMCLFSVHSFSHLWLQFSDYYSVFTFFGVEVLWMMSWWLKEFIEFRIFFWIYPKYIFLLLVLTHPDFIITPVFIYLLSTL